MKSERQRAIDRADQWFSRYIRLKYSSNGVCICYTTGKPKPIILIECGHFISRGKFPTRWDERNARPQSTYANKWKGGMHYEFRQRLIADLGLEEVENLERLANSTIKYTTEEIRKIAKEYREKANEEAKTKGKFWE